MRSATSSWPRKATRCTPTASDPVACMRLVRSQVRHPRNRLRRAGRRYRPRRLSTNRPDPAGSPASDRSACELVAYPSRSVTTAVDQASDELRRLDDPRLRELQKLIRRSFRVRENQTPIYVDVADNLDRIALDQHQIVFGRRGSGKSCLLIYFRRKVAPRDQLHTVYISADTIKTLDYPDVLIRLLLGIFEALPSQSWWKRVRRTLRRTRTPTDDHRRTARAPSSTCDVEPQSDHIGDERRYRRCAGWSARSRRSGCDRREHDGRVP